MYESLFVYGTLRPPRADTPPDDVRYYPRIAEYIQSHTPATLNGAQLYDLGAFPAVVPGEGIVQGDLIQVDPTALPIADRIEGHPAFYRRAAVTVQTASGPATAWIYWAPDGLILGKPRIGNGDWLRRGEASQAEAASAPSSQPVDPTLQRLVEKFAQEPCCWFSSVRPDGRAHSAPIWHVWHQGRAYVVTRAKAVRTINIASNPSVTLTHPDPMNVLILEGWATQAEHMREPLRPLFQSKYNWDIVTDTDYNVVIEVTPTRLIAWGSHGEGKWPGGAVLRVG